MPRAATRYIVWSQVGFYTFITICTIISPEFLFERNEGGMSNYGVHAKTVIPFTLAFLSSMVLVAMAAHVLSRRIKLKVILYAFSILLLLVMLSTYPYKVNDFYRQLHIVTGILLVSFETVVSIWLATAIRDHIATILLAFQVVGSVLALLTLVGVFHILFITQIITGVAFGALLVYSSRRW